MREGVRGQRADRDDAGDRQATDYDAVPEIRTDLRPGRPVVGQMERQLDSLEVLIELDIVLETGDEHEVHGVERQDNQHQQNGVAQQRREPKASGHWRASCRRPVSGRDALRGWSTRSRPRRRLAMVNARITTNIAVPTALARPKFW